MKSFEELQAELASAWAVNRPGSTTPHVIVALPSYSVGESLLSHYAERIPALEHRFLLAQLLLHRIPGLELVFLSSQAPGGEVVDYYHSLVPSQERGRASARFRSVVVPDRSARSIAAKLLDRPDVLDRLRGSFAGRPVLIEPWNVTESEVEVALRLQAPVYGTAPELRPLGYKSAGRRLFAAGGVPVPYGQEDVRTVDDVVDAVLMVRRRRPAAPGVVVKHDDSGAGDDNVVLRLDAVGEGAAGAERIRALVADLPRWYRDDLRAGGVVEELLAGPRFTSPSVQVDVSPHGEVTVLATHEQVLGGPTGQVYMGRRFPADPDYAAELARHGRAVGERLAAFGVVGRFSADFAAVGDGAGGWRLFGLEINLRKGGTAHPYVALRTLVPGRYDDEAGEWRTAGDGSPRAYEATDNLVDEAWLGLEPARAIEAVAAAGVAFDHGRGTGVVLHMLSCLAVDGRCGLTAIGRTPDHADELLRRAREAIGRGAR
ncbi:MAG TPA: peptide ligase PGM1-related protein [Acidimicrobiales bacterium]|nr:peptide ligase PGM1-related protein [Acidimicrobiales bacterium]